MLSQPSSKRKHYVLLHMIVFLWGWSSILGKLVTVNPFQIVWFRVLITVVTIAIFNAVTRVNIAITKKQFVYLTLLGFLICSHWLFFYLSIKKAGVSLTMIAFSTTVFFSAIFEPVLYKRKMRIYELLLSMVTLLAVTMIFYNQNIDIQFLTFGLLAGFTASLFSLLNGLMVRKVEPTVISFYELFSAIIGLTIYLAFAGELKSSFFDVHTTDLTFLFILALFCTAIPFVVNIGVIKHLSPYTVSITINLQIIYSIILAALLFHENRYMTPSFYVGTVSIIACVVLNAYLKKKLS